MRDFTKVTTRLDGRPVESLYQTLPRDAANKRMARWQKAAGNRRGLVASSQLAGRTRGLYHSVERIIPASMFSPLRKPGRISVTIRVAGKP